MEKFNPYDFNYEFDTVTYNSYDQPPIVEPTPGVPINAYKRFKAIHNGETYYMSGKDRYHGYRR